MTDTEILALLARCKSRGDRPWEVLVDQFAGQLVSLADRLTEAELYELLDVALACYQKGYEEFSAHREARTVIDRVRLKAKRAPAAD